MCKGINPFAFFKFLGKREKETNEKDILLE